jgi:putative acetyltransferase
MPELYSNNNYHQKIFLKSVSPLNKKVIDIINKLNEYQIGLYGIEKCNLETVESLKKNNALMMGAFSEKILVGIGAVKLFDSYGEIKRMLVENEFRGLGIAEKILVALENYAMQMGKEKVCLETGNLQHEAIRFYKRMGYNEIERFGSYRPNDVSIYFKKLL